MPFVFPHLAPLPIAFSIGRKRRCIRRARSGFGRGRLRSSLHLALAFRTRSRGILTTRCCQQGGAIESQCSSLPFFAPPCGRAWSLAGSYRSRFMRSRATIGFPSSTMQPAAASIAAFHVSSHSLPSLSASRGESLPCDHPECFRHQLTSGCSEPGIASSVVLISHWLVDAPVCRVADPQR